MTLPSRSQDYGLLDSSILMEAESEWKRAALTLHFPWAWDQASAVYCIFHFSGGVFSLARPPRNHRLPWAMVAGWVSKKNAKKAGDNRRKNGSPLPIYRRPSEQHQQGSQPSPSLDVGRGAVITAPRRWKKVAQQNVQRTAGLQPSRFFPLGLGPGVGGLLQRREEERERRREEGKKAENDRRKKG